MESNQDNGICCICGMAIKEADQFMHVRELVISPAAFEQPVTYEGLWLCFDCNDNIAANVARNARIYTAGVRVRV